MELAVTDLGVIADLSLVLGPGMTALTGETGAGKTLVVSALELLVGGRADPSAVRAGAAEATIEGRFVDLAGEEMVLARVVPASGRSRAYVNGRLAPVAALAEVGADLVDLHGQHAHQSLLSTAVQRQALDLAGGVDTVALADARAALTALEAELAAIGGDARARAREVDLLRYQVDELARAALDDPEEEATLEAEEDLLADAVAHREVAAATHAALGDDGGAVDVVAAAAAGLARRPPFSDLEERLQSTVAELADIASELRSRGESIEDDPVRLETVRDRRQLLRELRRKYGESLADVLAYAGDVGRRLADLESHDERAADLDDRCQAAAKRVAKAAAVVGAARRSAAPTMAAGVEAHLRELALPHARFEVTVGDADPGDDTTFLFGANPGEPTLPLSRVASGGELARTMLAVRLVLVESGTAEVGRTLVFDEVDAGVGGAAALAVGRALAALGRQHQVLVVTHLPQVAAFADAQVAVTKGDERGRTVAKAKVLDEGGRVVELSRMLSGTPESATAQDHAVELLSTAASLRGSSR